MRARVELGPSTKTSWALAISAVLAASTVALAQQPPPFALPAADLIAAAQTSHPKIQGPLRSVLSTLLGAPAIAGPGRVSSHVVDLDGRIAVRVRTNAPEAVVARLEVLGRQPASVSADVIEVYLAPGELLALESAPEVLTLRAVDVMMPRVVTQGRTVHNAANWQAGGLTGTGVRVGIIDWFQGIVSKLGTELPPSVVARCYTSVGVYTSNVADCDHDEVHGTAVAETIADMAPGAQLFIAHPISPSDLRASVNWMVANGVSVINFSAVYPWDGPGDGTSLETNSPLHSVDDAAAGGALFVAAAGNEGHSTWFGAWRDDNSNNVAQFDATASTEANGVFLNTYDDLIAQLRWSDSWSAAATNLELWLYNASGSLVASSLSSQAGQSGDTPSEYLEYEAPSSGWYYLKVTHAGGPTPSWIQLQAYMSQALQYSTGGSIANPAESANPGMLTAGAAWWNATSTIESFSSQGPTPDGRIKPDIVGADGADTATYGLGAFFGTSQATPHVVGLAALVKQAHPSWTPTELASYLKSNALPRGSPRPNNTWGWGFAYLPNLCDFALDHASDTIGAAGGAITVQLTASAPCGWTASESLSWLAITSAASGSGSAIVTLAVDANGGTPRSGIVTIAGRSFSVSQQGATLLPPRNLSGSVTSNVVSLNWLPPLSGTVTAYLLEAGTGPGLANLASFSVGTAPSLTTPAPNGAYYLRVRAMTPAGLSAPSNEILVTVSVGPPGPPINFQASAHDGVVTLSWQAGPGGSPSGYVLEAGSAARLANLAVLPLAATSLTISGVPPGRYFLRVRAQNQAGVSAPSSEVPLLVAPPVVPGPPINLAGFVGGGRTVSLQWQPPSSGGTPTTYTLLVGSGPGLTNVAVIPLGATMAISASGAPVGTYYIRVIASNSAGQSLPSNEITLTVF